MARAKTMTACSWLLLLLLSLATIQIGCWAITIPCAPSPSDGVEVPGVGRLRVLEDELTVDYYLAGLAVYEYEGLDFVNILVNDTSVTFTGLLPHEGEETRALNYRDFQLRIEGLARLNKSETGCRLRDCDIYFVRNFSDSSPEMPPALAAALLRQANLCIREKLCSDIGEVSLDYLNNAARHPHDFGFLAISRLTRDVSSLHQENQALQLAMNKLIDLAIEETTAQIRAKERRFVPLPDVERRFLGRRSFSATGGVFGDVSTLRRIEDAVVSNVGQRFSVSLGFGLDDALIYFKQYTVHNPLLFAPRGELTGRVTGIAIKVDLTLDFEGRPCHALLQDLRITRAGDMRVSLTGLGPLNRLLSGVSSWFAALWKRQVVAIVERNVRGTLQNIMDEFDCEALRP